MDIQTVIDLFKSGDASDDELLMTLSEISNRDILKILKQVIPVEPNTDTGIEIHSIFDRSSLIDEVKARRLGYSAYILDRLDTHWFWYNKVLFVVDPTKESFSLNVQGSVTDEMYEKAREAFCRSKYYHEMVSQRDNLEKNGYFDDGRWPGKDTYRCKHCNSTFKNGTIHEHVMYDGRIIPHNGIEYEKIKKAGLNVSWYPGISKDVPALEL